MHIYFSFNDGSQLKGASKYNFSIALLIVIMVNVIIRSL
jgi:hypothetical protein